MAARATGFPVCRSCHKGTLVPLSDYEGSTALAYKAWVCTNEDCEFNLKIRKGDVSRDEPVWDGSEP